MWVGNGQGKAEMRDALQGERPVGSRAHSEPQGETVCLEMVPGCLV